jgi:hypothetical protein
LCHSLVKSVLLQAHGTGNAPSAARPLIPLGVVRSFSGMPSYLTSTPSDPSFPPTPQGRRLSATFCFPSRSWILRVFNAGSHRLKPALTPSHCATSNSLVSANVVPFHQYFLRCQLPVARLLVGHCGRHQLHPNVLKERDQWTELTHARMVDVYDAWVYVENLQDIRSRLVLHFHSRHL